MNHESAAFDRTMFFLLGAVLGSIGYLVFFLYFLEFDFSVVGWLTSALLAGAFGAIFRKRFTDDLFEKILRLFD